MKKKDFEGLFDQLKSGTNNIQKFTIMSGLTGSLILKKAIGSITPDEDKMLEERVLQHELDESTKWVKFKQECEDKYNCHLFLNEKFKKRKRHYTPYECDWLISSWEDNQEMSEYITLYYKNGEYSLYFNPDSGYTGSICLKRDMSIDYIMNCIENWT